MIDLEESLQKDVELQTNTSAEPGTEVFTRSETLKTALSYIQVLRVMYSVSRNWFLVLANEQNKGQESFKNEEGVKLVIGSTRLVKDLLITAELYLDGNVKIKEMIDCWVNLLDCYM